MKRIGIVGGGITGLAAAYYLQRRLSLGPSETNRPSESNAVEIVLLEAQDRLGGVIGTLNAPPRMIEMGADNFATLIPDALQLCKDLGIEDQLIRPNQEHRFAMVVHAGKLYRIPQGFSLMQPTRMDAILASRVLSWQGKMRLLMEYFISPKKDDREESLQEFATRRLGKEAFERLVEPIVGGIFTARADRLSVASALPEFAKMEKEHGGMIRAFLAKQKQARLAKKSELLTSDRPKEQNASGARYDQFMAPKLGMQWWLDQIESRLNQVKVRRHVKIGEVERRGEGWVLKGTSKDGSYCEDFSGVIVAAPAPSASKLFANSMQELSRSLQEIPYASSAVVVMVVPKSEIAIDKRCFGIVVPSCEKRNVLAISMSSEKYPGRTKEDEILLRVFLGGAVRPELLQESDESLLEIAEREVKSLLGTTSSPRFSHVIRWESAMPQYNLGHSQILGKIESILGENPTLRLAGNGFDGVGIPQCIRSAKGAVSQLLNSLGFAPNQS